MHTRDSIPSQSEGMLSYNSKLMRGKEAGCSHPAGCRPRAKEHLGGGHAPYPHAKNLKFEGVDAGKPFPLQDEFVREEQELSKSFDSGFLAGDSR